MCKYIEPFDHFKGMCSQYYRKYFLEYYTGPKILADSRTKFNFKSKRGKKYGYKKGRRI